MTSDHIFSKASVRFLLLPALALANSVESDMDWQLAR